MIELQKKKKKETWRNNLVNLLLTLCPWQLLFLLTPRAVSWNSVETVVSSPLACRLLDSLAQVKPLYNNFFDVDHLHCMSSRVQLVFFVFSHVFCPIWIMAEKCLTSNMPVLTGYWIVFTISADLIYEIKFGERVYTVIRRCTVPGQCRSKGVNERADRGWLGMCSLMMSLIFCHSFIPSYNNNIDWQK